MIKSEPCQVLNMVGVGGLVVDIGGQAQCIIMFEAFPHSMMHYNELQWYTG